MSRDDGWSTIEDIGTAAHYGKVKTFTIGDDPLSSRSEIRCDWARRRDDWNVRVETEITMRGDAENFHLTGTYRAFDGDAVFAERVFERTIARDHL